MALLLIGIVILVHGVSMVQRMREESAYHVSPSSLQDSLLAALPEGAGTSRADLSVITKSHASFVSTTQKFADEREFEAMIERLKRQGWSEKETRLANTRIFCRDGAVFEVLSDPSSARDREYVLEASSGNYVFFCGPE